MALSANCKRAASVAFAQYGMGAELTTAVDANTLKTSMTTLTSLTTTTADATTTWIHTALKTLVADMKTQGHMA